MSCNTGHVGTAGKRKAKLLKMEKPGKLSVRHLRGLRLPWKTRDLHLGNVYGPVQSRTSAEWGRRPPHRSQERLITKEGGARNWIRLAQEWLRIVKAEQPRRSFFPTFSLEEGKVLKET